MLRKMLWNTLPCYQVPDPPGNNPPAPPPVDPPALPPTPPRTANQSDTERAHQLEGILADVRAEAAHNRIGKREAESREASLKNELATIRADAERRVGEATAAGNSRAEKIKSRAVEAEIKAAAVAEGLQDLDLLPLLDRAGVTCDDEGNVAGVKEAVAKFKEKKPEYFRAPGGGGGAPPARPEPTRSGSPAPPPPGPGAAPPAAKNVNEIPRTREGKQEYADRKRAALASLR